MNRFNLVLDTAARFAPRAVAQPAAATAIPAHIAAEWTGAAAKPESAADRVRRLLEQ